MKKLGDKTLASADEGFKKYGYEGSLKNLPASYLVGYLIGKLALKIG